jgi:hypothetical protein
MGSRGASFFPHHEQDFSGGFSAEPYLRAVASSIARRCLRDDGQQTLVRDAPRGTRQRKKAVLKHAAAAAARDGSNAIALHNTSMPRAMLCAAAPPTVLLAPDGFTGEDGCMPAVCGR